MKPSRARQRRAALRKAFEGLSPPACYAPDKVRYPSLRRARAAARAQRLREYQCGDHYHLTSNQNFKVSRPRHTL